MSETRTYDSVVDAFQKAVKDEGRKGLATLNAVTGTTTAMQGINIEFELIAIRKLLERLVEFTERGA